MTDASTPAQKQQTWEALATKALRGKPLADLTVKTPENITLSPIYWDDGGQRIQTHSRAGWTIAAVVESGGLQEAREAIADGATAIWIPAGADVGDLTALAEEGIDVDRETTRSAAETAHIKGADDATELACAVEDATKNRRSRVVVCVGGDVFASIAKVRALRSLLGEVEVHAIQGRRWVASQDVHTNMIRSTATCFAAATGGADIITLWPWDAAKSPSSRHARRIAVTAQVVAAKESHLNAVVDPAAGSYLLERWTAALVAKTEARLNDASLRTYTDPRTPLIGVTLYPNPTEAAG